MVPATVSLAAGASVPIPTLPFLSSKMAVSPMNELLLANPVHLVSRPTVPPPRTGRFNAVPKKNGVGFLSDRLWPNAGDWATAWLDPDTIVASNRAALNLFLSIPNLRLSYHHSDFHQPRSTDRSRRPIVIAGKQAVALA